jgi:hypothetical protein
MAVKPYARGIGFKYECRGTPEYLHTVQLYVRTNFPESAVVVVDEGERRNSHVSNVGEKTGSLLERVKRLGGKGEN